MDIVIPSEIAGAIEVARRDEVRRKSPYRVRSGQRLHTVFEWTPDGFVIESDGRPPLRGDAEVLRGDERVLQSLVICTWARDGLVGYEFKRDNSGCEVPADYVRPAHGGLLPSPR